MPVTAAARHCLVRSPHASKVAEVATKAIIDVYTAESSPEFKMGSLMSSATPASMPTDSPNSYAPLIFGRLIAWRAISAAIPSKFYGLLAAKKLEAKKKAIKYLVL